MRSGYITIVRQAGTLRYVNYYGHNWSIVTTSKHADGLTVPSAYYFDISNAAGVNPSAGPQQRWYGFPLRLTNISNRAKRVYATNM